MDPKTRAWAVETLQRGNLGGFGADKLKQAKAIFDRLRKERIYVEDPVDGEFMPSAACTLEGCDGLKFMGEDCDGLVIAFLSAVESVGIEGALVAHGYDSTRTHTHVLAAVRDDKRGTWVRCDPSTKDPFGTVSKATRETFIGIPGGKTLADSNGMVDAKKVGSAMASIRPSGDFVGVGRPSGSVGAEAEPVMGEVTEAFRDYMIRETTRISKELAEAWYKLEFRHEQLRHATQMMTETTGTVYSMVESSTSQPQPGLPSWTLGMETYYQGLASYMPIAIRYGADVAEGKREVAWDQDGKFVQENKLGYATSSIVILGGEKEPSVTIDAQRNINLMVRTSGVGLGPVAIGLIVGAVVVGTVFQYLMMKEVCDSVDSIVAAYGTKVQQKFAEDYAAKYGPDKAKQMLDSINSASAQKAQAEIDKERVSPFAKIAETAETGLNALMVIAIGAAAVYGISVAVDMFKAKQRRRLMI